MAALTHLRHELIQRLRSAFESWDLKPAAAYLFGSTARRESSAASDIDICIVQPRELDDPDRRDWRKQVDALASDVNTWTGNDVRMLELGDDEVRARISHDPLLDSIREDGIRLAGSDDPLADISTRS